VLVDHVDAAQERYSLAVVDVAVHQPLVRRRRDGQHEDAEHERNRPAERRLGDVPHHPRDRRKEGSSNMTMAATRRPEIGRWSVSILVCSLTS